MHRTCQHSQARTHVRTLTHCSMPPVTWYIIERKKGMDEPMGKRGAQREKEREGIGKRNRRLMGLLLLVLIIIVLDQSLRFSVGERKGLLIGGNEHFAIFHHGGAKCMFPLTGQCEGHHWYLDTELCGCRQCRQIHLPSSGCEG